MKRRAGLFRLSLGDVDRPFALVGAMFAPPPLVRELNAARHGFCNHVAKHRRAGRRSAILGLGLVRKDLMFRHCRTPWLRMVVT